MNESVFLELNSLEILELFYLRIINIETREIDMEDYVIR